jgi:hypothetical protein
MRVQVYYNLHKHVWSVKDKKTGRVIAHLDSILLANCKFIVREGGRQRVIKEKSKNVHAFIEGDWDGTDSNGSILINVGISVTYNPYLYDSFVRKKNSKPIKTADVVWMDKRQVFAYGESNA